MPSTRVARRAGFTLIEILVVIAIIGILAATLGVAVVGVRTRSFEEKTIALIKRLETGVQNYVTRYNNVPPTSFAGYVGVSAPPPAGGTSYDTVGKANYQNSSFLMFYLGSILYTSSGFNAAGAATIRKWNPPLAELKKSEVSTWRDMSDAAFGARYDANGIATSPGFVLDAWEKGLAYVPLTGAGLPATAGRHDGPTGPGSAATFPRAGSSFGKTGRRLTGFCQIWSRGKDLTSPLPNSGVAGPGNPTPTDSDGDGTDDHVDDICLWFLAYY